MKGGEGDLDGGSRNGGGKRYQILDVLKGMASLPGGMQRKKRGHLLRTGRVEVP